MTYYPIVYIRGYAMRESEIEGVFNKPYYGFNLGATQVRQGKDERPFMSIFESPFVRLAKDHQYKDAFGRYVDDRNNPKPGSVCESRDDWRRILWVFRYYDPESRLRKRSRPQDDIEQ